MSETSPSTFRFDCFFVAVRLLALWFWAEAFIIFMRLPNQVMIWRLYHSTYGKEVEVNQALKQVSESSGINALSTGIQMVFLLLAGWLFRIYSRRLAAWLDK